MHIFITGCSRGLGFALAHQLKTMGQVVHGTCRKQDDVARLSRLFGGEHRFYQCDATDVSGLEQVVTEITQQVALDAAVINAGVINELRNSWEISIEQWRSVLDVNLQGVVNAVSVLLPVFIRQKKGAFVAISSGWGRYAEAKLGPYCASKFAVEGLIGSLDKELAAQPQGVTAVALDPGGGINTDMLGICLPDSHSEYQSAEQWATLAAPFLVDDIIGNGLRGSQVVPGPTH